MNKYQNTASHNIIKHSILTQVEMFTVYAILLYVCAATQSLKLSHILANFILKGQFLILQMSMHQIK